MHPYGEIDGAQRIERALLCGVAASLQEGVDLACGDAEQIDLPALVPFESGQSFASAKFRVRLTGSQPGELQALMVPRQWNNLQVAINGTWLTPQRQEKRLWHDWNKPTYLPLAAPLLLPTQNTIDIVVSAKGSSRLSLYPVYVGDPDHLRLSWLTHFTFRTGIVRTDGALAILLGIAFLVFWRSLPRGIGAGWLPAFMASTALYSWYWSYPNVAPEGAWWDALIVFSAQGAIYCAYRFLTAFIEGPPFQKLGLIHTIMAVSAVSFATGVASGVDLTSLVHLATGLMAVRTMFALLADPILATPRLQAVLFVLLGLAIACGIVGWLQAYTEYGALLPDLLVLAPALLHIAIGWTLLERLVQLKQEREAINASLEQQVAQKSEELKRTYAALGQQRQRQAVTEERQRIMLDLHDGVGGQLVNTLAYVETAYSQDLVLQNALEDALRDMGLMIDSLNAQDDIATMLGMLRSRIEPLLARHATRFNWHIYDDPVLPGQTPSKITSLRRIVQEAITNSVKHSGANLITVEAESNSIRIRDNGTGFEPDVILTPDAGSGIGIVGMRKRAEDLGMTLTLRTSSSGTSVALAW